jgi:hypothetical protein
MSLELFVLAVASVWALIIAMAFCPIWIREAWWSMADRVKVRVAARKKNHPLAQETPSAAVPLPEVLYRQPEGSEPG